jgi:hypothetical protein
VLVVVAVGGCRTSNSRVPGLRDGGQDGSNDAAREAAPSCQGPVLDKKTNGNACGCAEECASGFCVDNVCCNSACDGTCQACNLGSSPGLCSPIPAGMAPVLAGQCRADPASSCGLDGTCDGAGGCRKYPDGSVCQPGTCEGAAVAGAKVCRAGACVAGPTTVCSPYGCDGTAGRCFDRCTGNDQCDGRECKSGSCGKKPLGAVCSGAADCDSNFCADGVCCNVGCTGPCVSCNQVGRMGECVPVPVGSADPHGVCRLEDRTTCRTSGLCNGLGGCALYAAGTECKAGTCLAGSEIPMSVCDGAGTCLVGAPVLCAPFMCANNACRLSCADNTQCAAPNVCVGGSCGKKPPGVGCAAASECSTNFCVDGVCCDSACTGTCVNCGLSTSRGRCTNVAAGVLDPRGVCRDLGAAMCRTNGRCDGNRACQTYTPGTICLGASCNANGHQITQQSTCRNGVCTPPAATPCAPYKCNGAACGNTCATNNDCQAPNTCINGSCGKKPPGAICARADECLSNFCVDGVCCNSACNSACQTCNRADMPGTCLPVAAGLVDPRMMCAVEPANPCGRNGTCNGAGACAVRAANTPCGDASCAAGMQTAAALCDGSGRCVPGAVRPCAPYVCNGSGAGSACFTSCTADTQCVPPGQCNASSCGKKVNGSQCLVGTECMSGNCVEGRCCNSACTESCKSCNVTGVEGTCSNVPNLGADPKGMCTAVPSEPCGNDGSCNGAGACRKNSGTSCRAASCTNGVETLAATCDGSGACPAPVTRMCGQYTCNENNTQCRTSCTSNDHCTQGMCGADMTCGKEGPGGACSGNGQCASGLSCVNQVCCTTGSCPACHRCNINGAGTCAPVPEDEDSGGACAPEASTSCGRTGKCGAGGACQQWQSGTPCGQTCASSTTQQQLVCNGSGTCGPAGGSSTTCTVYVCEGMACRTSCDDENDCLEAGKVCMTGMCVDPPLPPDAGADGPEDM